VSAAIAAAVSATPLKQLKQPTRPTHTRPFNKILIANRGEIACRIQRSAKSLGYRTVAVFSEADAQALFVQQADQAVCIGPALAAASYLNIRALLDAAAATGADALHPGYGFLSERADFAQACCDAGLVFIGPDASAIEAMGNKASAKQRMLAAGVPCAPGYLGAGQDDHSLLAAGQGLGVPLLVKAVAGGGGRGMRLVHDLAELPAAIASARREADSAFGDGRLMLEKLILEGRHVEVQVFADSHGHVLHLGERDCSAQRRRQKVIEEAPCPSISPAQRAALCADAVAAARAVGYCGAGTVEFIVDPEGQHHFLEMNTRLQVEHPVTECITGLDLVAWQLRVAAGEALPLTQDQIVFNGHAIEARLYAEDPYAGWLPQTGEVLGWQPRDTDIRIDHGLREGDEITPHYDAMVAKFIAHGHDRATAIRRLCRALEDVPLIGPSNNGRFLRDLLLHPQFRTGSISTTRLDEWAAAAADDGDEAAQLLRRPQPPELAWRIAAALLASSSSLARLASGAAGPPTVLRPSSVAGFDIQLCCQGQQRSLRAPIAGVQVLSRPSQLSHITRVVVDGVHHVVRCRLVQQQTRNQLHLALDGAVFCFAEASAYPESSQQSDPSQVHSPVAGVVSQLAVSEGDPVQVGQPLLCVEAMKMEMWLHAAAPATVQHIHAQLKGSVAKGQLLVQLRLMDPPQQTQLQPADSP